MVVATFSRRIEAAAYVSSKAGTQISRISLICDDQAEGKLSISLTYPFHGWEVSAAVLFRCQSELLGGMRARLEHSLVYFDLNV